MEKRKVSRGFRYHQEDLDRAKRLLEPRETLTDFIEVALTHEFERREGKTRTLRMSPLVEPA